MIIIIIYHSYSLMLKDSLKMLNVKTVENVIICDQASSVYVVSGIHNIPVVQHLFFVLQVS